MGSGRNSSMGGARRQSDLWSEAEDELLRQGVAKHANLDLFVERTVSGEAGRLVDLDEPGPRFLVYEDVKAEHLKAKRLLEVLGLCVSICMCNGLNAGIQTSARIFSEPG